MGLAWLGGFPQTALYAVMAASAYLVFRSLTVNTVADGAIDRRLAPGRLLGVGLGAVQLWPTLEMSNFSVRAGGVDYGLAAEGSMFPTGFASFPIPGWTSLAGYGLAGGNLYIGLIGLATVLLVANRRGDSRRYFFWGLAAFGCLLSLGRYSPLFALVYRLPLLGFLRVPSRYLYFSIFALAVLLAMAVDELMAATTDERRLRRLYRNVAVAFGIAAFATIVGSVALRALRGTFVSLAGAGT